MFDDVEGKIVETTEAPDGDRQQHRHLEGRRFQHQQGRGENYDDQEENSFQLDPAGVGQIFHGFTSLFGP